MIFSTKCYSLITFLLLLTGNASVSATPIIFEFTGTVNDKVTNEMFGEYGTRITEHPEWNGQQISGTVSLDLEFFGSGSNVAYSSRDTRAAGAIWMQVKLRNPDGTYFDSSLATDGPSIPFNPFPNSASANIVHLMDNAYYGTPISNLVLNRRYHDDNSADVYNYFELGLIGNADNANGLVSSKNFDEVIVKPEFANLRNYGMVTQSHRTLANPSYYFSIDSFSRVATEVTEPSALILLFSALFVVLVKRYKVFGDISS